MISHFSKIRLFLALMTFLVVLQKPLLAAPARENQNAMREIITSATYGVLAGTLVGAASLAFTDQPGENLQRVARGASLGLYAGLALGFYVAYVVPNQQEELLDESLPPTEEEYLYQPSLQVFPLIGQRGVEGVYTQWNLMRF